MRTRSIAYIDSDEDLIDLEVKRALEKPLASCLPEYFQAIAAQCIMLGIDVKNPPNTRKIRFIKDNE